MGMDGLGNTEIKFSRSEVKKKVKHMRNWRYTSTHS